MLRLPRSVPVARVGRSVPERRCSVPAARLMLGTAAAGLTLSWAGLTEAAPPVPIPRIGVPQPCNGGACGNANRNFVAGQGNLLNGASTAVNTPVWNPANNTLTITQNADKVILNWGSFNIASGNTVVFAQPGKTSVAMNKIWDSSPSQIFGNLQANGSVYLINQNGIVFGQGAQVAVGGLLASSLNLQNNDFLNSILSPATLGNALLTRIDDQGNPYSPGDIQVQAGANISTPTGATGQILLAGGNVNNAGTLHSPDGQTLLLAGDSVWVAPSDGKNSTVRGFVVAVDDTAGSGTTGVVSNTGSVLAERGNVTLAGLTVNQQGVVHATTSVNFNGSIFLTAGNYAGAGPALNGGKFLDTVPSQQAGQVSLGGDPPTHGGNLVLGPGSSMEVRPDLTDTSTAVDAQAQLPSTINLQALNIVVGSNASVAAPGGAINMVARSDLSATRASTPAINAGGVATATGGSIVVDAGAVIDVSGTQDVVVPVTREFVQAQLRGNELADSPQQRNGFLYTQNVTVDVRGVNPAGNIPLANISGYVGSIGRTVGERTSAAGTVTLDAGSTVALRQGASVNLSGGYLNYQGGFASTTKLLASNGKVYDIMSAPANLTYVGFADRFTLTSKKWGTGQSWLGLQTANRAFMPGYLEGRNAGALDIFATQTALDGTVVAQTTVGVNQRTPQSSVNPSELANPLDLGAQQYREAPLGGLLALGDAADLRAQNVALTHTVAALDPALTDSAIVANGLPNGRSTTTYVPMDSLTANGVSAVSAYAQDTVTVVAGTPYQLPSGGSINLVANTIQVNASITAHDGSITARAQDPFLPVGPALATYPTVSVANGVVLDVSGEWVNDSSRQPNPNLNTLKDINGGTINMTAAGLSSGPVPGNGGVTLGLGSVLDVSGGAYLDRTSTLYAGKAGSITVSAPGLGAPDPSLGFSSGATFLGYGFAGGGSLSLTAPQIRIGQGPATAGDTVFAPGFFQQGGFANVTLNAEANLTVDPGASITAQAQNRLAVATDALLPTGTSLNQVADITTLPATQRANPMSVTLNSLGGGVVSIGQGASLVTDPRGSIGLQSTGGRIYVDGTLSAPSGSINLTVKGPNLTAIYDATQSIWLGPQAQLLAAEASAAQANAKGRQVGGLINDGGNSVTLNAQRGSVVSETGSLIDVSGTQVTVDVAQTRSGAPVATTLDGSAGTISISAADSLHLDGKLRATAGGPQGAGGTLNVALNYSQGYDLTNTPNLPGTRVEQVTVYGAAVPALPAGLNPGLALPTSNFGTGVFSLQSLNDSGIDALSISSLSKILFGDSSTLQLGRSLTLNAPVIGGVAGAVTKLQAPVVTLTGPNTAGGAPVSTAATGASLTVQAQQLDVTGNLALTGYDSTLLHSSGDLRLIGTIQQANGLQGSLQVQNALSLDAAQVYPATLTQFGISASDSIGISNSQGNVAAPLSAGGSLSLSAPVINQNGVLRAPFGTLNLNASSALTLGASSVTSVSGSGLDVPFGNTANGQNAYYSLGTAANAPFITLDGAPAKSIALTGSTSVMVKSGATVDLSGGGDLLAFESVIGPGGSKDILNNSNTYAILPGTAYAHSYAPYDPLYASSGASVAVGSQVYLSGGPFSAGYYTLLPSHYALLPGAFAIKLVATPNPVTGLPLTQANGTALVSASNIQSTLDPNPGVTLRQPDGSYLVAGKLGVLGTSVLAPRWSTWQILPASVVHQYSELDVSQAISFYPAAAGKNNTSVGVLPGDAGSLLLSAGTTLNLPDNINVPVSDSNPLTTTFNFAGSAGGRGGELDLSAHDLAVVANTGANNNLAAGTLAVSAATLDALQTERLVLGGRVDASTGVLSVGASTVTIANDAISALTAPDLIIAATNAVTVRGGSVLSTRQGSGNAPLALSVASDSAILRLTDGQLPGLQRTAVTAPQAVLNIQASSDPAHPTSLTAAGSITLDSASAVSLDPATVLQTPALRVDASSINLGAVQGVTGGASLTQATLAQAQTLFLQATQEVRLYGNTNIGSLANPLGSLTLDAPSITSTDGGTTTIAARNITLQNSSAAPASASAGTGTLNLHAQQASDGSGGDLVLGSGQQTLNGFAAVGLQADHAVTAQGIQSTPTVSNGAASQSQAATAPNVPVAVSGLTSTGAITVTTPLLQASANTNFALTSSNALTVTGAAAVAPMPSVAAGGRLALIGSAVTLNTSVVAPGGAISLHATSGDVVVGSQGSVDASGYTRTFQGSTSVADAGSVSLMADQGSVRLAAQSQVRVDAVAGGNAGAVILAAPQGSVVDDGVLSGKAGTGQTAGSLTVDVASLDTTTLAALTTSAASGNGDFVESVNLRVRSGDLTLPVNPDGSELAAHTIKIAVDQGSLTVQGTLSADADAHHTDAGNLALWAGNSLTLDGQLSASSPAGAAGTITLGLAANSTGLLSANPGASIALNGSTALPGTLNLVAPQTVGGMALGTFAVDGLAPATGTAPLINLQAVQRYDGVALNSALFSAAGPVAVAAGTLATQRSNILAALPGNANTALFSSVEIDHPTLDANGAVLAAGTTLDLSGLHFVGTGVNAGVLTVRTPGDLTLGGTLSDGFVRVAGTGRNAVSTVQAQSASAGGQWSYQLVAGADTGAADPLAVSRSTAAGSLNLLNSALIRTGTGSIHLASAGDVKFSAQVNGQSASVYTAGVLTPFPSTIALPFLPNGTSGSSSVFVQRSAASATQVQYVEQFTSGGGDVTVDAGGNVQGAGSTQQVNDWLYRSATVSPSTGLFANPLGGRGSPNQTAWWVEFDQFHMDLGALGGGNVTVNARGSVSNLSAALPTNGRQGGGLTAAAAQISPANLYVEGGGNLAVHAGGDILGGSYYVERGQGLLQAGGSILANPVGGFAPVLAMGDSQFSLVAGSAIDLLTAYNPFTVPQVLGNVTGSQLVNGALTYAAVNDGQAFTTYFSTYDTYNPVTGNFGTNASLHLLAQGGDVSLGKRLTDFGTAYQTHGIVTTPNATGGFSILPATVDITAQQGNFSLQQAFLLAPSPTGNLRVRAGGSVDLRQIAPGNPSSLALSSASAAVLANPSRQVSTTLGNSNTAGVLDGFGQVAANALHQGDTVPVTIIADLGSILGTAGGVGSSQISSPKPVDLVAGQDISGLSVVAQNIGASDVSSVNAGRDIVLSPHGQIPNGQADASSIEVDGPGRLLMEAGRNIDLGSAQGVISRANNTVSSTAGANISLYAGLGNCNTSACMPAFTTFGQDYINPASAVSASHGNDVLLQTYMNGLVGNGVSLSKADAWTAYQALSPAQQSLLDEQVLANELHLNALDHNLHGTSFAAGYQAIGTLFPGSVVDTSTGKAVNFNVVPTTVAKASSTGTTLALAGNSNLTGNVSMVYSQVRTLSGGDIGVFTPTGGLDVGLANQPPGTPKKTPDQLGLVTQATGSVRAVAANNINVNSSRIFSVGGGDISLWSSFGNIDAGKGAKSVQVVPPPTFGFNSSGQLVITVSGATTGSGIGALLTGPGQIPGNVDLIAPVGTVDAGDAGIRAAGNLNIAAAVVLNAANIQVGGASTGVPTVDSVSVAAPAPSTSANTNAAQSSDDTGKRLADDAKRADDLKNSFKPTIVTVEVSADDDGARDAGHCNGPDCRDKTLVR